MISIERFLAHNPLSYQYDPRKENHQAQDLAGVRYFYATVISTMEKQDNSLVLILSPLKSMRKPTHVSWRFVLPATKRPAQGAAFDISSPAYKHNPDVILYKLLTLLHLRYHYMFAFYSLHSIA